MMLGPCEVERPTPPPRVNWRRARRQVLGAIALHIGIILAIKTAAAL